MSRGSGIWIGVNEEGNDQKSWQGKQKVKQNKKNSGKNQDLQRKQQNHLKDR